MSSGEQATETKKPGKEDLAHETHKAHKKEILYPDECYKIQGAVFEVYREMGNGFLESVYQECLEKELTRRKIPFRTQVRLELSYKGDILEHIFKPDFICYDKIILELKSVKRLGPEHVSQVLNYLNASNLRLGLLINFGHYPRVEVKRIIK